MHYATRMTAISAAKLARLLLLALWPFGSGLAAEFVEAPEEITVLGRQPGPPLWKVGKGEHVLWIFPYLGWIPKEMSWDSTRVARVLAESQEFLDLPEARWLPPNSVMLNPINLARATLRSRGVDRNPDGGTLQDNLSPDLFARFAAVKARYFPANDGPLEMRPLFAGRTMLSKVRKHEGLVPGDGILKTIRRQVRRTRGIEHTEISVTLQLGDDFDDYATGIDTVYGSFQPQQEQACFAQQLRYVEDELAEVKRGANSWALGYVDAFRDVDVLHNVSRWALEEFDACSELFRGASSPDGTALVDMAARVNQLWLDAAERALASNISTFAVLPINELLADDGLLNRLKAAGYEVREP